MERHELERYLPDYFAGELDAAQAEELARLIESDPAARAEFEAYQRQDRQLSQYYGRARERALAMPNPLADLPARPVRRHFARQAWLAAAAVLFIALGLGVWLIDRHTAPRAGGELARVHALTGAVMIVRGDALTPLKAGDAVIAGQRIKVAAGGYLALELPKGNVLEARGGSQLTLQDYPDRFQVTMHRGQVWAFLDSPPPQPFTIQTSRLKATAVGTVYGVEDTLDRSVVAVARGTVRVEDGGAVRSLAAGSVDSSRPEAFNPTPPLEWSQYPEKLASLAGAKDMSDQQLRATLADVASTTTTQAGVVGGLSSSKLIAQLPADSRWFVSIRDWPAIVHNFQATDYSALLDEPAIRQWWDTMRVRPEIGQILTASHIGEVLTIAVLLDGEFVLGGGGNQVVLLADCRQRGDEVQERLRTLYLTVLSQQNPNLTAEQLQARSQDFLRQVRVAGGRLIIASDAALADQTAARLTQDEPGSFNQSPFYRKVEHEVADPSFVAAVDLASVIVQTAPSVEEILRRRLDLTGFLGLDNLIIASDFTGRGMNQAARLGFAGQRQGIMNWLAEPGPMRGLEYLSADVHAFASMRLRQPRQILADLLTYEAAAGNTGVESALRRYLEPHAALLDSLGGELTIGLDSPILPIPNVKIALEVNDRATAERELDALVGDVVAQMNAVGRASSIDRTEERGRTIHAVTVAGFPITPAWAFVNDYLVLGPGPQFVKDSIDVLDGGRSVAQDPRLLALLPAAGDPNYSLLLYQDILRSVGEMAKSSFLSRLATDQSGAMPNLSFLQRYRAPGLAFAYAYADHIDLHMSTPEGVDLNLGLTLPAVANWLTPQRNNAAIRGNR